MPTTLEYSLAISDVRVTVGKSEFDCLQKIHPVGRFLAFGFAGSVRIGFATVNKLKELLVGPAESAWDPLAVADWWPADAREVFARHSDGDKAGQCHLLLISADPTRNAGEAPWGMSYVHIFRSPNFDA